jgi:hypothetical protein
VQTQLFSGQLTLAAAAQRLSNAYGGASLNNAVVPQQDVGYRQVLLMADAADAFIGMDLNVTSTVWGTKVDSTDLQPVVLGPFETGPIKLSDIWVAGAGATIHVTGVVF